MPRRRPLLLAAAGTAVLVSGVLGMSWAAGEESREPCPDMPHWVPSSEVHLIPGFDEHQNTVAFHITGDHGQNGLMYAICRDGTELPNEVSTRQDGKVTFNVRTRWVDAQWLLGRLAEYGQ